jgi:putative glutamate/gamma-aminobutyrate antiporter
MSKRTISVFMLAMINVAAIGSVKNWPTIAENGFSSIFFFLLATLIFFIPTALVSAELATGWPKIGGVFVWVKEAFGHRAGFLAIWLLWIENVVWYPTILSFIAATFAYLIDPALASNKFYMLGVILTIFWATTLANLQGMRISGWISSIGVILGTLIPAGFIISLGIFWYLSGRPLQISLDWQSFIPNMSSPEQLVFFTGVILSLCGMEMSAIHARDVKNPQKNYPRAIWVAALIIFAMSVLGVLAIAFVIPQKEISLTAGSMQALLSFVTAYNLHWVFPVLAALVVIGAIASLSTWIVGPSRGLLAAAESGDLPHALRSLNKHDMPLALLIGQGLIVTFLSLMFILMPTLNSAYWILTVLVAQVYLVMYILMFAAAIKLRYTKPRVKRAYQVPGGKLGMWIISGLGILSSVFAMLIGFFPPAQIPTGNVFFYVSFLVVGMAVICLTPSFILCFKKPSWNRLLPHEGKDN